MEAFLTSAVKSVAALLRVEMSRLPISRPRSAQKWLSGAQGGLADAQSLTGGCQVVMRALTLY